MDTIDRKLVDLLAINCRRGLQDLSRKTGVSANEVKKRIESLVKSDVIHDFVTILSPLMTNELLSIAVLEFDLVHNEKDLLRALSDCSSVWRVHRALEDKYVVFSVVYSDDELASLAMTYRGLKGIGRVDIFSRFMRYWGGKIDLTADHKKILRWLVKDARMSVADIARKTGLESNVVSDSIDFMRESESVLFTINATDYLKESRIEVLAKVQWNVGKTSQEQVSNWLQSSFPTVYLREYVSVIEPTLFFNFSVNHVQEVAAVMKKTEESGIISIFTPLILFPASVFSDPRERRLDEILTETGFS
ncbi:MAG: AsnC family transcriptional regulator [Candidatus Thorarchaeota archaeon]|jgi:DNA-binding Lrp family transcriptional regulator